MIELTIETLQNEIARLHAILGIEHDGLRVAYADGNDEYTDDGEPQVRIWDNQVSEVHPISTSVDVLRDWASQYADSMKEDEATKELDAAYGTGNPDVRGAQITAVRKRVSAKWQEIQNRIGGRS